MSRCAHLLAWATSQAIVAVAWWPHPNCVALEIGGYRDLGDGSVELG